MINIIVCMKQVLDPEAPTSTFKVDSEAKRVVQRGVPLVLNPFDENALEAALRIKDTQETKITVISMGSGISKTLMTKTLAVGADQAIILNRGTSEDTDSYATALTLAMVIRKIGEYDLILTGMQAADTNAGIVGSGIAEILGISSIIGVRKIEVNNRKVKVERIVSDGYDLMESPLPALITVAHELGDLRTTNLKDILAAQRKPITPLTDSALGTQPFPISRIKLIRIFIPQKESRCELISGENEEVKGSNLALRLKEASLLQRSGNN